MIRTVLVATDGSEVADAAVRTGINMTISLGPEARLHVATAVDYVEVPTVLAKHPADAPDLLAEEASSALAAALALARNSGIELTTHLLRGDAVEGLLACAGQIGADILVVGAQGRSRIARVLFGSVASLLVRDGRLPVVVVSR